MSIANEPNSAESTDQIRKAFEAFVTDQRFPCLAGKGAVHRGDHTLRVYDVLGTTESAKALARALPDFRRSRPADAPGLRAFVALFRSPIDTDELTFERRL